MSKKKAIICTILFGIIIFAIATATCFIKGNELTLFEIISPSICGLWCGECIGKFYEWLTK